MSKIVFRTLHFFFPQYDVDVLIVIAVMNDLYNVVLCHFNYFWPLFLSAICVFISFCREVSLVRLLLYCGLLLLHAST